MSFLCKTKVTFIVGCCLLTIILIPSCATAPTNFETPSGSVPGDQFGPMEVTGIISRISTSLNRQNGKPGFSEDVLINVPVGTEFIIPAMRGWILAYGELEPNTVEAFAGTTAENPLWKSNDHHFGEGTVNISVKDINAPNVASNTQTATITIKLNLGDNNHDDRWFGRVSYTLICLRRQPTRSVSLVPKP